MKSTFKKDAIYFNTKQTSVTSLFVWIALSLSSYKYPYKTKNDIEISRDSMRTAPVITSARSVLDDRATRQIYICTFWGHPTFPATEKIFTEITIHHYHYCQNSNIIILSLLSNRLIVCYNCVSCYSFNLQWHEHGSHKPRNSGNYFKIYRKLPKLGIFSRKSG